MSLTQSGTQHAVGSSPLFTAAPGTLLGWIYSNLGQARRFLSLSNSSDSTNTFQMGTDVTSATSPQAASAYTENTSSNQNQALTATTMTANTWQHIAATYVSNKVNNVYLNGANKGTHTTTAAPTSVNQTILSGRASDFNFGVNGQVAHLAAWSRALSDVEIAYLGAANGNPRYLSPGRYWKCAASETSTITDQEGTENLTVTSMTAGTTDPHVAPFWTAAAQGNQTATQGGSFTAIDLTTKFDQMAASVDYTCTLLQVGAAGTTTTANGSATTASQLLTVNSASGISAGNYITVGSSGKILVLYVSSNTLLLATATTWNNADTVTPYPTSAPTGLTTNGYTITANVTGGTVGAGAVGTYNNLLYRATNNSVSSAFSDSALFSMTVSSSGTAPSFSAGPTLASTNTDGWTYNATSNQTATLHIGVYVKGSATPSNANIKAGAGTGFAFHTTTALTASVQGSIQATGLVNPFYDVYILLNNANGDSAVYSSLALLKSPPAGKQYVTAAGAGATGINLITAITQATNAKVTAANHGYSTGNWVEHSGIVGMTQMNGVFDQITVVDANNYTLNNTNSSAFTAYTSGGVSTWGQSEFENASTQVAAGDIAVIDQVTTPDGLPITLFGNGAVDIAANGVTARQNFAIDVYSVSLGGFIGVVTDYFQNVPPQGPVGRKPPVGIFLAANQAIAPYNAAALASSPQGDTLTVAIASLPSGLSVSTPNIVGTTGGNSSTLVAVTVTDAALESTVFNAQVVVGQESPPNFSGQTQGNIQTQLDNLYLPATFTNQPDGINVPPFAAGLAIAQNPPFGIPVNPGTTINITLSNGSAPQTVTPPVVVPILAQSITARISAGDGSVTSGSRVLVSYDVVDVCLATAADPVGTVYVFPDLPSNARIIDILMQNDANPSKQIVTTSYKCGLFTSGGTSLIAAGSDSILAPAGLQLDTSRSVWTSIFSPSIIGTNRPSAGNVLLALWQLLGLSAPPSPQKQYTVGLTAINPGAAGGNIALRVIYVLT